MTVILHSGSGVRVPAPHCVLYHQLALANDVSRCGQVGLEMCLSDKAPLCFSAIAQEEHALGSSRDSRTGIAPTYVNEPSPDKPRLDQLVPTKPADACVEAGKSKIVG